MPRLTQPGRPQGPLEAGLLPSRRATKIPFQSLSSPAVGPCAAVFSLVPCGRTVQAVLTRCLGRFVTTLRKHFHSPR